MTVSLTTVEASGSTTDASSYLTGTLTPLPNCVLLIFIEAHRGGSTAVATPTLGGGGLTYTSQATNAYRTTGTIRGKQFCYRAKLGTSPGSFKITIDFGATHQNCHWFIYCVKNTPLTGANAADAILQQPVATGTGTTGTVTLAAAGASANRPISFFTHFVNEVTTPRTNWTELSDQRHASPAAASEVQWRSGAFETTSTATWSKSSDWGGISLELVDLVPTPASQTITMAAAASLGLAAKQPVVTVGAAPTSATGWHASGIDAAGFQNVLARNSLGTILIGGDVSGVHISGNNGAFWLPRSRGFDQPGKCIAALTFHPDQPNKAFALAGSGSGLWRNSDVTALSGSWEFLRSATVRAGNWTSNNRGQPEKHPRFTGKYFAWGPTISGTSRWLYYATLDDGVFRSNDEGVANATRIAFSANSDYFVRAIKTDPTTLTTLWVGTTATVSSETNSAATFVDGGLFKVTNATTRTTPADETQRVTTPFNHVWDMDITTNAIYVAGAIVTWAFTAGSWTPSFDNGVWKSTDNGASWTRKGVGTLATSTKWRTVHAYARTSASNDVVWVGASDNRAAANDAKSVYRSLDSATTFSDLTSDTANYNFTLPDGTTWWMKTSLGGQTYPYPYGSTYVCSDIATSPTDRTEGLMSGRSGAYRWTNGQAATVTFRIAVDGHGATINPAIAVDPTRAARVNIANVDWNFFYSVTRGETVTSRDPGAEGSYALFADTSVTPAGFFVGTGNRDDNGNGGIYYSADPTTTAWTRDSSWALTEGRPFTGAARTIGGTRIAFAAAAGYGIRRKVGTADWSAAASGPIPNGDPANKHADMVWLTDSTCYHYDPQTGLWRNLAANTGNTWTLIWAKTTTIRGTGFITGVAGDASTVWVAVGDGLWRVDAANSATPAPVKLTGGFGTTVGPCIMNTLGTKLYVYQRNTAPTMWSTTTPYAASPTWVDEGDSFIRQIGPSALGIAISLDRIYLSMDGHGMIMADLSTGQTVIPEAGTLALSAFEPQVNPATITVSPEMGDLGLDALDPNVIQDDALVVAPTLGDLGLTAPAPEVSQTPPDTSTEPPPDDTPDSTETLFEDPFLKLWRDEIRYGTRMRR